MRTADTTWLDLDHWLPAHFQHTEDRWRVVQARVLTLLLLLCIVTFIPAFIAAAIGALCHFIDSAIPAVIAALGSTAALACLHHFRRSADLNTASHFYAWTTLAMMFAVIACTGGWQSPVCIYLLTLPIMAGFAMKQRGRLLYAIAVGLLYSALFMLHRHGYVFPRLMPAAYGAQVQAFVCALTLLSASTCLTLFDSTQDRLSARLARDKAELERHATEDLLTGALNEQALLDHMEQHSADTAMHGDDRVIHIIAGNYHDILQFFGADKADAFIAATAQRLQQLLEHDTRLGRYAIDEFVIHAPCSMAARDFTRLRDRINALHGKAVSPADGSRFLLDLRIGVSSHAHATISPRAMIDDARATIVRNTAHEA